MKKNNNRAELHAPTTHGAPYFYSVIKQAIWLLKENNEIDVVDIYFHPLGVVSPAAILTSMNVKKISQIPNKMWGIFNVYISRLLSNSRSRISKNNKSPKSNGMYKKIFEIGHSCTIQTAHGDLAIFAEKKILTLSFKAMLVNDRVAIKLWLGLYVAGKMNAQRLLNLTYNGILIGDLIASTALRQYPKAGGDLHKCKGILFLIVRSVALVDYCKNHLITSDTNQAYITIPEQTYLQSIYRRALHSFGANVLEPHHYRGHYKIIQPKETSINPGVVQNTEFKNLTNEHREKAIAYLNSRIERPGETLWYMFNGKNRTDEALFDLNEVEVKVQKNQLYTVVFLHSFDDGQYWYGIDGFDDLYHWTTNTIDSLLGNKGVNMIFVKPHPNSDYFSYPGDKVALQRLTKRYKQNERVVWLGKDISPKAFVNSGRFFGITHHGSVAEELTYLGVPVIAGIYAPWGKACKFVHAWSCPNEYREMLTSLSADSWHRPSEFMRDELYRFVLEYRIGVKPIEERAAWMIFANLIDGETPKITLENYNRYGDMLSRLPEDSTIFRDFIGEL